MKELLKAHDIIKEGHFKLTSGRHSNSYINKDAIYCNPFLYRKVYTEMWQMIKKYENNIDLVTGPAIAGAILAQPLASLLGDKIFVYPEKIDDKMVFRRGYDKIIKNKRVWITEDIITTGGSVEKTIQAINNCDGEVLGTSVIWNRGDYKPSKGLFLPMINEAVYSHLPENCPECANNIKLTDPKE